MLNLNIEFLNGNKFQKFEIEEAIWWVAQRLLGKRYKLPFFITVEFVDLKGDSIGSCEWDGDYVRPKDFYIEIERTLPLKEMISVVIHEMVHVWQYASGRLKDRAKKGKHITLWCGQDYTEISNNEKRYTEYPWEHEAYRLQEELTPIYINEIKKE